MEGSEEQWQGNIEIEGDESKSTSFRSGSRMYSTAEVEGEGELTEKWHKPLPLHTSLCPPMGDLPIEIDVDSSANAHANIFAEGQANA